MEHRPHWSGEGVSCDSPSPLDGELCTKILNHDKTHHVRGQRNNWHDYKEDKYHSGRDYNDMSEGEWQAFGRFGY